MDPIEATPVLEQIETPTITTTTSSNSLAADITFIAITMVAGYTTGKAIEKTVAFARKALKKRKNETTPKVATIAK